MAETYLGAPAGSGMSDTKVAPQLQPSDWANTANSYIRNDGKYIKIPDVDRLQ